MGIVRRYDQISQSVIDVSCADVDPLRKGIGCKDWMETECKDRMATAVTSRTMGARNVHQNPLLTINGPMPLTDRFHLFMICT